MSPVLPTGCAVSPVLAAAVDQLTVQTEQNFAVITGLTQVVTDLDSSTASRFEKISAEIGVQNSPSGMQSQVLFLADRFVVMSQTAGQYLCPLSSIMVMLFSVMCFSEMQH